MRGERSGVESEAGAQAPPRSTPKWGGRAIAAAAIGGAAAMLLREDVRNRLLDLVFGAEEEFDYSSVTEPEIHGTEPPSSSDRAAPWVNSSAATQAAASAPAFPQEDAPASADAPAVDAPSPDPQASTTSFAEPAVAQDAAEPAERSPVQEPPAGGSDTAAPWSPRAIAPSPAAWGEPPAGEPASNGHTASGQAPASTDPAPPPPPPRDWWSPDGVNTSSD